MSIIQKKSLVQDSNAMQIWKTNVTILRNGWLIRKTGWNMVFLSHVFYIGFGGFIFFRKENLISTFFLSLFWSYKSCILCHFKNSIFQASWCKSLHLNAIWIWLDKNWILRSLLLKTRFKQFVLIQVFINKLQNKVFAWPGKWSFQRKRDRQL